MTIRYWLTHPSEALCDWGIRGCELHKRSGWFPWWNRKPEGWADDGSA